MSNKPSDPRLAITLRCRAAADRRLNRRSFMQGAIAMGLTIAGGNARCGRRRVAAQTPKAGGHFRVGAR